MTSTPPPSPTDIRPVVGREGGTASVWIFMAILALGAVALFTVLDGRRRQASAPAVHAGSGDRQLVLTSPPPLELPADVSPATAAPEPIAEVDPEAVPASPPPPPPPPPPRPEPVYAPAYQPPYVPEPPPIPTSPPSAGAVLVIDATEAAPDEAIRAGTLSGRAHVVPQGTLIPAVLETALDSTRPGQARAIVSQDVVGFDGSQVLIPRGSRLFGEYQADMAPGQKRAMVQWTRLVRPDGVVIALASPIADASGRIGVAGRIDNHFLARFGSALLRTTLNIGASLAGRSLSADNAVIVALPGATSSADIAAPSPPIQPTLRVDAGTRIAVLVARDLRLPGISGS